MSTFLFPPDPNDHWADQLAEKASEDWSRQHRLRWAWLRLRQRLQGEPRPSELEPGEGRCPDLPEPALDPDETARIRRAWLRHLGRDRQRRIAAAIERREREDQRQQDRWLNGQISQQELEHLHRRQEAHERTTRFLRLVRRLLEQLLSVHRTRREMQCKWLAAPCWPVVMLSSEYALHSDHPNPGLCDRSTLMSKLSRWRQREGGRLELMSSTLVPCDQAEAEWTRRRALGWRLVPPQG